MTTAKSMARLDDLIEKAGIKPGDRIEILFQELRSKPPEWRKVPGVFKAVHNGGLECKLEPYEHGGYSGSDLDRILEVRKQNEDKPTE